MRDSLAMRKNKLYYPQAIAVKGYARSIFSQCLLGAVSLIFQCVTAVPIIDKKAPNKRMAVYPARLNLSIDHTHDKKKRKRLDVIKRIPGSVVMLASAKIIEQRSYVYKMPQARSVDTKSSSSQQENVKPTKRTKKIG